MNTQRLVATAAVASFLFGCASAHASVISPGSVYVTYTTSTSNLQGSAPGITYGPSHSTLPSPFTYTSSGLPQQGFLTTSPGGDPPSHYASERINFHFTFTDGYAGTGTLDTFATYYARYTTPALGCDISAPNQANSDCIIWDGTLGSSASLGTGSVTDTVNLLNNGVPDGSVVALTFYNAHDWTITSNISGTYSYTPGGGGGQNPVPEPASIVLLASGIAGLQVVRRCFGRKPSKSRAA
jgi:hypothetical protein